MKKKLQWIIPTITYIIAVILVIIAFKVKEKIVIDNILAALIVPIFSFLFPIISKIIKRDIPLWMNVLVCLEMLLCVVGGNIYNIYKDLAWYDIFLHIYFGFSCTAIFYYFILHFQNDNKINKFILYTLLFLAVLGMGAIWEFWEYVCDLATGGDGQMVNESIALGKPAVSDTIEDMFVTMFGVVLFYLLIFIDYKLNNKLLANFKRCDNGSKEISRVCDEDIKS